MLCKRFSAYGWTDHSMTTPFLQHAMPDVYGAYCPCSEAGYTNVQYSILLVKGTVIEAGSSARQTRWQRLVSCCNANLLVKHTLAYVECLSYKVCKLTHTLGLRLTIMVHVILQVLLTPNCCSTMDQSTISPVQRTQREHAVYCGPVNSWYVPLTCTFVAHTIGHLKVHYNTTSLYNRGSIQLHWTKKTNCQYTVDYQLVK